MDLITFYFINMIIIFFLFSVNIQSKLRNASLKWIYQRWRMYVRLLVLLLTAIYLVVFAINCWKILLPSSFCSFLLDYWSLKLSIKEISAFPDLLPNEIPYFMKLFTDISARMHYALGLLNRCGISWEVARFACW